MKLIFICFKEIELDDNDKFTLDFSNTEIIYEIDFLTKNDYYITSLNCDLIVKENNDDKSKLIKDLSEKSRLLLEKGPPYQNDNEILYFVIATRLKTVEKRFKFDLPNEIIESNCWQYEYFDVIEKK